jgi:predicted GNAT family N-acyltransferase
VIEIRQALGGPDMEAALALRHAVFIDEQQVDAEHEHDDHDAVATHFIAVDDGRVVATCRVFGSGDRCVRLGRLAVDASARRRGVASALLVRGEQWARERAATEMVLAAQTNARPLYEQAGYVARGDAFMEAGIEHVMMHKPLV